jgi:hypothetical protein
MLVAADIEQRRLWFGWLEHVYPDYPRCFSSNGEIEFELHSEVSPSFRDDVSQYIGSYYSRVRDEATLLGDRLSVSRFLLHATGIARTLTQIHLELTCGKPIEEIQDSLHFLFLEYGTHDSFLFSLHEPDSPWRQPLSSRIAIVVTAKLEQYVSLRSHFWMRERRVEAGDFHLVPFSYSALSRYLIPTLDSAWDLQETLARLLALGSSNGTERNQAPNSGLVSIDRKRASGRSVDAKRD